MLPTLNEEQLRVLSSMNRYWKEVSERDEPRRSRNAADEIEQMLSVITPLDALLIVGHFAETNKLVIPNRPGLEQYMHHLPSCNINQNWDEAAQALADTPRKFRDEGFYQAEQELDEKRKKCTCGYKEIIAQLPKKE